MYTTDLGEGIQLKNSEEKFELLQAIRERVRVSQ